jgi:chromosome segregation ATPase
VTTKPQQPVDPAQISQRLAWLDEERRRDKGELARLVQEVSGAVAILKDQAAKTREAGDRINAIESTLARLPRLEDAITAARSELIPLRDADIRLQDEMARQGKDARAQSDQTARLWSDVNGRVEGISKTIESLTQHLHLLDTQRKDNAKRADEMAQRIDASNKASDLLVNRVHLLETQRKESAERAAEMATRLDALSKASDVLLGRIQLLETQRKENTERVAEMAIRLDALPKVTAALGDRLALIEARERERLDREAALQARIVRLETTQEQAIEDIKRSVARVEALIVDIQQMRREMVLAQEEDAKQRTDAMAGLAEQKEAVAIVQLQLEDIVEGAKPVIARLEQLENDIALIAQTAHRVTTAEEQIAVLQAMYKGLQEVEDRHWNTDIPLVLHAVEEATASTASSAASVQELVASTQALKESVRELQVNLVEEHDYSDDLAAALRSLIEEDLQSRLAAAHKQMQSLRRLANAPVEKASSHE